MENDKSASLKISQSLRLKLSDAEQQNIEDHLEKSPESRVFAKLSESIQDSVVLMATSTLEGDDTFPGLTNEAKSRLKDSVRHATEKASGRLEAHTIDARSREDQPSWDGTDLSRRFSQVEEGDPTEYRDSSNRFAIQRKIGDGGLGNVWLAKDEKLNRQVAIKELKAEALEFPKAWARFHREAEITGKLEHPNIVPRYVFGNDRVTGEPFYAMRFVGKRTLGDAIEEYHERIRQGEDGKLQLHRLLSAFLDVCQAIAYAHSRGVVHRDLKPQNVALDSFGQVIVLDWGLAKVLNDDEFGFQLTTNASMSESSLAHTMAGEVVGTPLYMAPEQAEGSSEDVDRRTDVYGLGGLLFEILTGHAPHAHLDFSNQSDTEIDDSFSVKTVLNAIIKSESPTTDRYDVSVPNDLKAICEKAMAYKAFMRYESASELAEDVEKWIAGQNERQRFYDTMRMEGREFRTRVQSARRDLETNTRFMSKLPPIQEITDCEKEESCDIWRERLSTIFTGLLQTNVHYQSVSYCRIDGDQYSEIVRAERHSTDSSNIRNVPKSRLTTGEMNEFLNEVAQQKPEEVIAGFTCEKDQSCKAGEEMNTFLLTAVPVYSDKTEELFGFVAIECNFKQIFNEEAALRLVAAQQIFVVCQLTGKVLIHRTREGQQQKSFYQNIGDLLPGADQCIERLNIENEYVDETNRQIYANKLSLDRKGMSLTFVMSQ
ncbi:MAG: serine/threonine-protein kinase [Planctomycetota bacterium]